MSRQIFYIANARIPSEKAHPYQILKMCEAFEMNGVDIKLILPYRLQSRRMKKINMWEYYKISRRFTVKKIPAFDFLWLDILPELQRFIFYVEAASFSLFTILYTLFKRPDIYYTRDWPIAYLLGILQIFHKRPVFYEAHTFEPRINKLFKKSLNGLVVITRKIKELYVQNGVPEHKIYLAPDGVDMKLFDIPLSKDDAKKETGLPYASKIIGYVGQFHTMGMEKGVNELLEAFDMLKKDINDLKLCFVGGTEEAIVMYKGHLKSKGLENDVIFVGQKPPHKVPLYTKCFDVCVMPFPWNTHYAYYMSPLKLFEYMASKRPIVATDLPSVREILNEESSVLVKPGDSNDLAQGLKKVLSDKVFATKITEKAYCDVQNYTWHKRAERILNFIKETK